MYGIQNAGGPYGGPTGYNEGEASGHHPIGHNAYEDGYGVPQVCHLLHVQFCLGFKFITTLCSVISSNSGGNQGHIQFHIK